MTTTMTFSKAASNYFGKLPGQTLQGFVAELKGLTDADKAEMAPMLADALGVDEVTFSAK